ncbi:MAG: chemotaxis protein CheW [Longimicrobiales bacterium]
MQGDATIAADASVRPASQWAFFVCGERGFAVPLERVAEILPPQAATRLPGCGPVVHGLVGFRGRVITVFDLGVIAGQQPAAQHADYRVVFVRHAGRLFGFIVEAMVTIAPADNRTGTVDAPGGLKNGDVRGTVPHEGRPFLELDVDHLLGRLLA